MADINGGLVVGAGVTLGGEESGLDGELVILSDGAVANASAVYIMRAYKTTPTTGDVYWASPVSPDATGASSGYSPGDLTDIVVIAKL
jgi:hypothetical protein